MKRVRVADVMTTAVTTVRASEPVTEARETMDMGAIRHLPVVDQRGHLVGILSDRDVNVALANGDGATIADVMTREVLTVRPDAPAAAAATIMLEHRIHALPVIDDGHALVGVITASDLMDVARRALLGQPLGRT